MTEDLSIYTRTGDGGDTSLYDGSRIPKCHPRIEVLGAMDELTSYLAVCRHQVDAEGASLLGAIQKDIYQLNAIIATPGQAQPFDPPPVASLESAIDAWKDTSQSPCFLQVGSSVAAAHLHYARTICRRAERRLWLLAGSEPCDSAILRYVNRLSDLLYVMAVRQERVHAHLTRQQVGGGSNADGP